MINKLERKHTNAQKLHTNRTLTLVFYSNGNYVIKSTWREEKHYGFDALYSLDFPSIKLDQIPMKDLIDAFSKVIKVAVL